MDNNMNMTNRKQSFLKKNWITITMIVLGLVIIVSGIMIVATFLEYRAGDKFYSDSRNSFITELPPATVIPPATTVPTVPPTTPSTVPTTAPTQPEEPVVPEDPTPGIEVNFARLREINPDIIGWILVKDTPISYPLLAGIDNEKYLKNTYDGTESRLGSIFVDMLNANDFSDNHTLIYGHNMQTGAMFGRLSRFGKQDFVKEHPYVYIITPDGYLKYKIFSAHTANVTEVIFTRKFETSSQYREFINLASRSSWITGGVSVTTGDKVITLVTCTSSSKREERFVVHAVLIEDTRK